MLTPDFKFPDIGICERCERHKKWARQDKNLVGVYICKCGHIEGRDRIDIEHPQPFGPCHNCERGFDSLKFKTHEEEFRIEGAL